MTDNIQYVWLIIYLFALVSLFTYGMNCYLLMIFYRLKRPKALKQHAAIKNNFYRNYSVKDWPRVTIQLPIFNERYVVERLIQSVCQFDYPRELLEIQILDDSTDDTIDIAQAVAAQMKDQGFDIQYIHRDNRIGFKAGALKEGLKTAKGELVGIFDADFVPHPNFLKETVPYFTDPEIGMLQTRWGHINSDYSLLTRRAFWS
jgi:cellulose synthase/poly-beta-1,6-N-acetylglucosamine synthase-like glycosyltransferase